MSPRLVKLQISRLDELQIAPIYCVLKVSPSVLVRHDLWFCQIARVSPKPHPSSIGYTVEKKTACLPLFRLDLPGINPFLIIDFNSFAFPTW